MQNHDRISFNKLEELLDNIKRQDECKTFIALQEIEEVYSLLRYNEKAASSAIELTLINHNGWVEKYKEAKKGIAVQETLSLEQLKKINTLTVESAKGRLVEAKQYYFSRYLQLFFTNEKNWVNWENQFIQNKAESHTISELTRLKQQWFSQHLFAIAPAKVLLAVQHHLDNLKLFIVSFEIELKLNKRKCSESFLVVASQTIAALKKYQEFLQLQLLFAMRCRLLSGIAAKSPDSDHTVNYFLNALLGLGVTCGEIDDTKALENLHDDWRSIQLKDKIPNKENEVKPNVPYALTAFRTTEPYRLTPKHYRKLHETIAKHSLVEITPKIKPVYEKDLKNPVLRAGTLPGQPIQYVPNGIRVPFMKPSRFLSLFTANYFQYGFALVQQLTLARVYWLNEIDVVPTKINVANFDESDEKKIVDTIQRCREEIVTSIAAIDDTLSTHNNVLFWQRRAVLQKWKAFYKKQLEELDIKLERFCANLLSPNIESLILDENNDRPKHLNYYTKLLNAMNVLTVTENFTQEMKNSLNEKAKHKIETLKSESEKVKERWGKIIQGEGNKSNALFMKEQLSVLLKNKESIEKNQALFLSLFKTAKTAVVQLHAALCMMPNTLDVNTVNDKFQDILNWLIVLGRIGEKAKEFAINDYIKPSNALVQKISYFAINVLTRFGSNSIEAGEAKKILDCAIKNLGKPSQSSYLAPFFEKVDIVLFNLERAKRYQDTTEQSEQSLYLGYEEQYTLSLTECKQTFDVFVIEKNLQKLKTVIDHDIALYLQHGLKLQGQKNAFMLFNTIRYSKMTEEDIIESKTLNQELRNFLSFCPKAPLLNLIKLARCIDNTNYLFEAKITVDSLSNENNHNVSLILDKPLENGIEINTAFENESDIDNNEEFDESIGVRFANVKQMLQTIQRLAAIALPHVGRKENSLNDNKPIPLKFNNFFSKKFAMVAPLCEEKNCSSNETADINQPSSLQLY